MILTQTDFDNFTVTSTVNLSAWKYHYDKYLHNICVTQTDSEQESIFYLNVRWIFLHKLICICVLHILNLCIDQQAALANEQQHMNFILNDNYDAYADNMQYWMWLFLTILVNTLKHELNIYWTHAVVSNLNSSMLIMNTLMYIHTQFMLSICWSAIIATLTSIMNKCVNRFLTISLL